MNSTFELRAETMRERMATKTRKKVVPIRKETWKDRHKEAPCSNLPIRVVVSGSRGWCCQWHKRNDHATCISCRAHVRALGALIARAAGGDLSKVHLIHGDCRNSPDVVAEAWAIANGVTFTAMPADWGGHGKWAGALRNSRMAEHGTHLVALWDGHSRGTKNMIEAADKMGLRALQVAPPAVGVRTA